MTLKAVLWPPHTHEHVCTERVCESLGYRTGNRHTTMSNLFPWVWGTQVPGVAQQLLHQPNHPPAYACFLTWKGKGVVIAPTLWRRCDFKPVDLHQARGVVCCTVLATLVTVTPPSNIFLFHSHEAFTLTPDLLSRILWVRKPTLIYNGDFFFSKTMIRNASQPSNMDKKDCSKHTQRPVLPHSVSENQLLSLWNGAGIMFLESLLTAEAMVGRTSIWSMVGPWLAQKGPPSPPPPGVSFFCVL